MKVSREQVAANRDQIVATAAALFRERGFDGVSVAEVMQGAGLTHGAFYGYFPSKDALAAEAAAHAMGESIERWQSLLDDGSLGLTALVDRYLSPLHRDRPAAGCAIAAVGSEVRRQDAATRKAFAAGMMNEVELLASYLPGRPEERRRKAIAIVAQLVGGMIMARAAGKTALSEEILAAVHHRILS